MKKQEVPQDCIRTLHGEKKLVYAVSEDGTYSGVPTSGWTVEGLALEVVIEDYRQKAQDALRRFRTGSVSPVEFFMNYRYMDLITLSQAMGLPRWRIRRDMKASVFSRLPPARRHAYARIFRITPEQLDNPESCI